MIIYGKQSINYLIEHYPKKIQTLYLSKELDKKEYSRLMRMDFELKRIPHEAAQKMTKNANHQGFVAEVDEIELKPHDYIKKCEFVLVLSSITDMGNIGAIVRSAYALGVDAIVMSGVKQPHLDHIARTSSGALFDMPFIVQHNLYDVMSGLKDANFELYGAVMDGEDIRGTQFAKRRALVLGNEGAGLSNRAITKLDKKIKIEMAHNFDSLNVSVAGAILMDRMR